MNIINLADVENLTDKLYGNQPDASLMQYAGALKENYLNNPGGFVDLFSFVINSNKQHCLFWSLDLLSSLVNSRYETFSEEMKMKFRETLIFLVENQLEKIFSANFIVNKFSVLFINWLKHDYPENWPSLFKDLINSMVNTEDQNVRMLKASLLIEILHTFDDELIKFRHTYSDYEGFRSTKIKDYMRLEAVGDCVYVINQLMTNEAHFPKKLIKNCIRVVAELVDWNNLNLFADSVKIITENLIGQQNYLCESLEVMNAILSKGMEPMQKLEVVKYLNINEIIDNLFKDGKNINSDSLIRICEIVATIGNFTVEAFEMVKSITKGELQVENNSYSPTELFNHVCELANYSLFNAMRILKYSLNIDMKSPFN